MKAKQTCQICNGQKVVHGQSFVTTGQMVPCPACTKVTVKCKYCHKNFKVLARFQFTNGGACFKPACILKAMQELE